MQPVFLTYDTIDREKWDHKVANSLGGLIYAESYYLDTLSPGWSALVAGEYGQIMPLPRRRKWGIDYLFQPFLTPQLGIMGENVTEETVLSFIDAIPVNFRLIDLSFNFSNPIPSQYKTIRRSNYILPLLQNHATIKKGFAENTIRSIRKAHKAGCGAEKNIPIQKVIQQCRKQYSGFTKTEKGLFDKLERIYHHYHAQGRAITFGVFRKNELLSSAAILFSKNRIYYWMAGNSKESRNIGSSHLLVDEVIKEYAEKSWILDFEGSDHPGVARFYQQFGAQQEPYWSMYVNQLPLPLRLFKRTPPVYKNCFSSGV